jgi:CheY-like chemotaxis protein
MSKEAPFRMEMSEILKVGERAAYLTQQLLEFNRKQVAQPLSTVFSSASKEAQDTIHSGYETILLVEDDAALARPLQRLGYTILEADGITEAIRICAQYSSPIHLLLADIALLGMSGIELYANLREIHTEMKALIMSSHSKEAMPHQDVPVEEAEFIQKPFKTGDLALRLRTILDHR